MKSRSKQVSIHTDAKGNKLLLKKTITQLFIIKKKFLKGNQAFPLPTINPLPHLHQLQIITQDEK